MSIQLEKLTADDVGRWVAYHPWTRGISENGRIKSWNSGWVFVVYNCGDNWNRFRDYTAAPTDPSSLSFIDCPLPDAAGKEADELERCPLPDAEGKVKQ